MSDELATTNNEMDLIRQEQARRILELTLYGDESQARYSIEQACRIVGISRTTYWRLRRDGFVSAAKSAIVGQMNDIVHEKLLPIQARRFEILARIAIGLPVRKGGSAPSIPDILAANKILDKVMPTEPIGAVGAGAKTPLDHIKDYQPKTVNFNFFGEEKKPDWLYSGASGVPRFGELDTSDITDGDVRELTDDDIIRPGDDD